MGQVSITGLLLAGLARSACSTTSPCPALILFELAEAGHGTFASHDFLGAHARGCDHIASNSAALAYAGSASPPLLLLFSVANGCSVTC